VGEPHAGIIDVLLGVDEPRTLRMVGAVLRSAARIAAIEQGDVRLHFSRNPGDSRLDALEPSEEGAQETSIARRQAIGLHFGMRTHEEVWDQRRARAATPAVFRKHLAGAMQCRRRAVHEHDPESVECRLEVCVTGKPACGFRVHGLTDDQLASASCGG